MKKRRGKLYEDDKRSYDRDCLNTAKMKSGKRKTSVYVPIAVVLSSISVDAI